MSTANHSVSKYRNHAQKKLEEKQSTKEIGAHETDNGRVGWDHQIHTSRLPRMIRSHMYTRLYRVPCQLCLTTSLPATDGISHEGPRFFTLVQPWRTSIFLCLSDPSHLQEQAGSMPSTQAVAPSPNYNRDGSEKVRTFDKRTRHHKPFNRQRFVSALWLHHAQLRDLVEVWALTGGCSPPVGECSPPDRNRSIFLVKNLCRFRSKFAWALPLSLILDHEFFSQKRQIRTRSEN